MEIEKDDLENQDKKRFSARKMLPLALLCLVLLLFFAFGGQHYVSLDMLHHYREHLSHFVANHGLLAYGVFIFLYIVVVACSLPGGTVLTLAGGFLFGTLYGGLSAVVGATIGSVLIFLAAKTALGDPLRARAGPMLYKFEEGFRENAMSYMLFLRLIPLFPFFLVNLAPAFLGVSLKVYVIATFIGILPATFVYAGVGNGLGAVFDAGGEPDLGIVFSPQILLPIIGLALLALLPVGHKWYRQRQSENS